MMDRRRMLSVCIRGIVGGAAWLRAGCFPMPLFGKVHPLALSAEPEVDSVFDQHLLADMKRLGTRVYSEEGIPMILACEDLTGGSRASLPLTPMNVAVSQAFHGYVDAWEHLKPDPPPGDVAKLLELLADRDFSGGGKDTNL